MVILCTVSKRKASILDFSSHSINALFQQLGLPATDSDVESFFAQHKLDHDTRLIEADFWTEAQSTFLKEALEDDADWTEMVDQLDARLRH